MTHLPERLQTLPPPLRLCRLDRARQAQRLVSPASMKRPHHSSVSWRRQLENGQIDAGSRSCMGSDDSGGEISAAGDAHVAIDAWAIVPAIDDEVVPLRFQADGAVDRGTEEIIVGGRPQRPAQVGSVLMAEAGMQRAGAGDPYPVAGFAEIM